MRRRLIPLASLALVLAACSSETGDLSAATTTSARVTTAAPDTTTQRGVEGATSTTEAVETTGTTSGRPLAPDFTLELGDGASFTLSEGAKPVYLVFWAEW